MYSVFDTITLEREFLLIADYQPLLGVLKENRHTYVTAAAIIKRCDHFTWSAQAHKYRPQY